MTLEAIDPATNRTQILSSVDHFDFNWHINYVYADEAAPLLPAGTVLHMIGIHDNTSANRRNPDPNMWVGFGERSVDDMLQVWLNIVYLDDAEFQRLVDERKAKPARRLPAAAAAAIACRTSCRPGGRDRFSRQRPRPVDPARHARRSSRASGSSRRATSSPARRRAPRPSAKRGKRPASRASCSDRLASRRSTTGRPLVQRAVFPDSVDVGVGRNGRPREGLVCVRRGARIGSASRVHATCSVRRERQSRPSNHEPRRSAKAVALRSAREAARSAGRRRQAQGARDAAGRTPSATGSGSTR